MTQHKILHLLATLMATVPAVSFAQTFNGGDLDNAANWTGGLPTSGTGTVATDGSFDTTTPVTGRDWSVNQTGGIITQTDNATAVDFDGGSWSQSGGQLNLGVINFSSFDLTLDSGATYNQQNTNTQGFFENGSTITVNAGAIFNGSGNPNDYFRDNSNTSIFAVNGGTVNSLSIRGGHDFNLSGGSTTFRRILGYSGTINIGASGTFTSIQDTRGFSAMDWAVASSATAEIEDADWAELAWDAGQLLYNGFSNTNIGGSGATWAEVTTPGGLDGTHSFLYDTASASTPNGGILSLAAVPEPSSAALLAGLFGLGLVALRRR